MGDRGMTIRWRTIEWWGAITSLFVYTGAVFPLLLMGPEGALDDAARAKLRLLMLPCYLITAAILCRNMQVLLIALRRNLQLLTLLMLPLLSTMWSISPSITLRRAVGLLLSMLFSYMLAIRFTPRQILFLIATVLGFCMVASLMLMIVAPGLALMPVEGGLRGVFIHKNVMGWAAMLSSLTAGILALDKQFGFRRLSLLLLGASLACLLLSGSATALVGVFVGLALTGFFILLARGRDIARVVLTMTILQFTAATLFFLSEFLVPILEALGKDATLTGRVPLWNLVKEQITHRFLLGSGYQAFWTEGNSDVWRIWELIGWGAPHSHNGYYELMLGLGLVGAITLAVVIIRAAYHGAVLHNRQPDSGWLWFNVFVGVFLVLNLTESMMMNQNDFFWILFATAAIAFSLRYPEVQSMHIVFHETITKAHPIS
jgi:exopolysaccharide production protein ExoQ